MIGSHGDDFDRRNVFLQLALGVASASRRLDRIVAAFGQRDPGDHDGGRPPMPPASGDPVPSSSPEDEALVDFVLGLVSFRNHATDALESARRAPRPAPNPAPSGSIPDLLR